MWGRLFRVAAGALVFKLALVSGPASVAAAGAGASSSEPTGPASGLPLPRFVSLKADQVNLRAGPSRDYPTTWVYKRAGLPLEVVKEFDAWREVRDADGTQGWILQSLLSGRRTALVLPWDAGKSKPPPQAALRRTSSESAAAVATVEAGVIANVLACDGHWCHVAIERYRGYIEQSKLWGVYEGEVVK